MSKTTFVRAQIKPTLKKRAERILCMLGITPAQAITMLYKQVVVKKIFPPELKVPNAKTIRAMRETDVGIGLVKCKGIGDLFDSLKISNVKIKASVDKTDWKKVAKLSDKEIDAAARLDKEARPTTKKQLAKFKRAHSLI